MSRGNWVRRGSSRLYLPRGFAEGEAFASRGLWVDRRYFSMLVNPFRFGGGAPPLADTYYLNTDVSAGGDGSIGDPWATLEEARAGIIALIPSFVTSTIAPTLICTGATDDATAVTNTWPTSSTTYYLTITVPTADRVGEWDASHYTYARSASGVSAIDISTNSLRLEGLQIRNLSNGSASTGLGIGSSGGDFFMDGVKMWCNNGSNSVGIRASNVTRRFVFRNVLIVSTVHGILLGNPNALGSGSEAYIYNSTIWGSGSGGEACQVLFSAVGSGRVARVKNMMMYAQANGITVSNADTDDQATNSKGGVDTSHFVNAGATDFRLVSGSANVDAGTDLSAVGAGQFQFSDDVSLFTRPHNSVWDRGFYEYRP